MLGRSIGSPVQLLLLFGLSSFFVGVAPYFDSFPIGPGLCWYKKGLASYFGPSFLPVAGADMFAYFLGVLRDSVIHIVDCFAPPLQFVSLVG